MSDNAKEAGWRPEKALTILTETQTTWLNRIRNEEGGATESVHNVRRLAGMVFDLIGVVERLKTQVSTIESEGMEEGDDNAKETTGNGSGESHCYAVFGNKRVACTGCGWWHLCRTEEIGQRLYDDHKCGRGPFGCKCKTLNQAVTGDGCDECNPEYAAEMNRDSA